MTSPTRPLKSLERVLSKAGVGSRTDARAWILAGRVTVNGAIARQPEAVGDIRGNMILMAALVEGAALIAILLSFFV